MAVYENKGSIAPTYIVTKEPDGSGNYVCPAGGTSDENWINQAITDLTPGRNWKEAVKLKGDFSIETPILIDDHTLLTGPAYIFLASGANCNMIETIDGATGRNINWEIARLALNGNRSGNLVSGHGIYYTQQTASAAADGRKIIRDIYLDNIRGDGIRIRSDPAEASMNRIDLSKITVKYADGNAIHLFKVFDSTFYHFPTLGSVDDSLYIESCATNQIDGIYFEGTGTGYNVHTVGLQKSIIRNLWLDSRREAMYLEGFRKNVLSDIYIEGEDTLPVNKTAITLKIGDGWNCFDNEFNNIIIISNVVNKFKYGIEEVDANQDNNTYSNINGRDCTTATLNLLSINGMVDFHTIQGEIIAPDTFVNADPVPLDLVHYVNATPSVHGLTIDATNEIAYYFGSVPHRVSRGLRVAIEGKALAAPGVGNQMNLQIDVDAGHDNEAFNTHTGGVVDFNSYGSGNAVNDIIDWVVYGSDIGAINSISGGTLPDSVRVTLTGEGADAPDIATDAGIYRVVLYCV